MRCIPATLVRFVVLGLVAACGATPATPGATSTVQLPTPEPTAATPSTPAVDPTTTSADDGRPVPARVADLHRSFFEPTEKPVPGGKVRCIITVHDGELSHGRFYAVILLAGGSVATWTQSSEGRVEPFLAKLTPEEDTRALGWLEEIGRQRGAARDRFPPTATVVGISLQPGDGAETSYFGSDQTPEPLDALVRLLKSRLEATNAR